MQIVDSLMNRRDRIVAILLLVWLLVLFLQSPLLLSPSFYLYFSLGIGIFGLLFALLADRVNAEFAVLLGLFSCLSFVSATSSGYFWNSFEATLYLTASGVLFLIVNQLNRSDLRQYLSLFFLAGLIFILPTIIYQYFQQVNYFSWAGFFHFPAGNFLNPNVFSRFLALAGLFFYFTSRPAVFRGLGITLMLLACFTGSRGAILGLSLAFIFHHRYFFLANFWRRLFLLLVILLLLVVLVGNISYVTNLQRIKLVGETFQALRKAPVTGIGAWNFALVYPQITGDERWQRHPHNLFLWIFVSFGTVGFLAVGIGFWFLYRSYATFRYLPVLVYLFVHEMVDTMFWLPGILLITVLFLPLALRGFRKKVKLISSQNLGRGLIVLISLGLVGGSLAALRLDLHYKAGLKLARNEKWQRAQKKWKVGSFFKQSGFVPAHRGMAHWKIGNRKKGLKLLRKAAVVNEYDAFYPFLCGYYLEKSGNTRGARVYYGRARRRDPRNLQKLPLDERQNSRMGGNFLDSLLRSPDFLQTKVNFQKLRVHPRSVRWYIPFVDRSLKRKRYREALKQIELLENYPILTGKARRMLIARKYLCYALLDQEKNKRKIREQFSRFIFFGPKIRRRFHYLFYRRAGVDYAYRRR